MISNRNFLEGNGLVYAFPHATPSTALPPYVSLKHYQRCTIVLLVDKDSTGATSAITVKQASAIAGTGEKALNTFTCRSLVDAASGTLGGTITAVGDAYADVTVTAGTFTTATTASKNAVYVIEVKATDLDLANGFDCIRVGLGDSSSSTHVVITGIYILRDATYEDTAVKSAIID